MDLDSDSGKESTNRPRVEMALKGVRVEPAKRGCSLASNPIGIQRETSTRTTYDSREKPGRPIGQYEQKAVLARARPKLSTRMQHCHYC